MKLSQKFAMLASIGFGVGVIVGVMICALFSTMLYADGNLYLCSKELIEQVGNPLLAFTIQALASGLYGVLAMGGSVVYGIEEWGLVKCTAIHYIAILIGFFILAFTMKWYSPGDGIGSFAITIAMMTVAYIAIWLANYLSYRSQLNQINKELDELKALELSGVSKV